MILEFRHRQQGGGDAGIGRTPRAQDLAHQSFASSRRKV